MALASQAGEERTIVMACRNKAKAEIARTQLLEEAAEKAKRDGRQETLADDILQILIVDLSNTKSVFRACEEFKNRFTRLDCLLLNAGILPCSHMNIGAGVKNLLTRPSYVAKTGGDFFAQYRGETTPEGLGQVFAANVFGHYIMTKELEPALLRSPSPRILWFSSTTAAPDFFDASDFQCLQGSHPYESSKRLCELLASDMAEELRGRGIYSFVVSPGNCFTGLLDQGQFIAFCWVMTLYLVGIP